MLLRFCRALLFQFCLLGIVIATPAGAGEPMRQVDMGSYTVLSNASDQAVVAWVKEFEQMRRALVQLTGIKDEQLLPMTILLLKSSDDFNRLLPTNEQPNAVRLMTVKSVAMDQQPIIALVLDENEKGRTTRLRGAAVLWWWGSNGINYDKWIAQGFSDLFASATIKRGELIVGAPVASHLAALAGTAKTRRFVLDKVELPTGIPWLAVHGLTIDEKGWRGFVGLTRYQQRVEGQEPRDSAFQAAFGFSPAEFDQRLSVSQGKGKIRAVKVPFPLSASEPAVELKTARPGIWELQRALFLLRQPGIPRLEARNVMMSALEQLPPGDPRSHEAQWLYNVAISEPGAAYDELTKAVQTETKNPELRLQWCVETIDRDFRANNGMFLTAAKAREVADVLAALQRINPHRRLVYELYAQLLPSLDPRTPADQAFIVQGGEQLGRMDALLTLGLVAWNWREGRLDEATELIQEVGANPLTPAVKFYADWLTAQIEMERALGAANEALARNASAEVLPIMQRVPRGYTLMPYLAQQLQDLQTELLQGATMAKAEALLDAGKTENAVLLLENLREGNQSPRVIQRIDALLARARAEK